MGGTWGMIKARSRKRKWLKFAGKLGLVRAQREAASNQTGRGIL